MLKVLLKVTLHFGRTLNGVKNPSFDLPFLFFYIVVKNHLFNFCVSKKRISSYLTEVNTPFSESRYYLARNLTLLTTVLLSSIGLIYLVQGDFNAFPLLFGGVISLIAYLFIIKVKVFKLPTILSVLILSIVSTINLTISSNFFHVIDVFWMVCISMASFFILGKKWGISITVANLLGLFIIVNLINCGSIEQYHKPFTNFSVINFLINLVIAGILFIYLILEFLKQNENVAYNNIKANIELTALNNEKTVMLKEIHHRVKNNLQIVTSLLRIQSNDLEDTRMKSDFKQAIDRILAIAKIHDKMYNNDLLNQIDLADYLTELLNELVETYAGNKTIEKEVFSNINSIDPKNLVPIALLFNELVTNSLKHAFTQKKHGKIKIEACIDSAKNVTIIYHDNGIWAVNEAPKKRVSIGLELVDSFVNQLDAKLAVSKTPDGTTYTIQFILT